MSADFKTTAQVEAEAGAEKVTLVEKAGSFWSTYGMPTLKVLGLIGVGAAGGFYYHKAMGAKTGETANAPKMVG